MTLPVPFDPGWFVRVSEVFPAEFWVLWEHCRHVCWRTTRWPFEPDLDARISHALAHLYWSDDYSVDPDLTRIPTGEHRQLFSWFERVFGRDPHGMGQQDPRVMWDSELPDPGPRIRRSRIVPIIRCDCRRRLTFAPRRGIEPRVHRECPRCGKTFDPSATAFEVDPGPDLPRLTLPGGTFYRFALRFDFWTSARIPGRVWWMPITRPAWL